MKFLLAVYACGHLCSWEREIFTHLDPNRLFVEKPTTQCCRCYSRVLSYYHEFCFSAKARPAH